MGFLDTFKGKQYKTELEALQAKYDNLASLMTPEMKDAFRLQEFISELEAQKADCETQLKELNDTYQRVVTGHQDVINKLDSEIEKKKQLIITFDDTILVQEFGLYSPRYDFTSSDEYREKLTQIRNLQKECIKKDLALSGNANWTVNDSAAKGKKMVKDMQKLLLRAFNSECDDTISKIKYNNIDASIKKINSSAEAISKLGTIMKIAITENYLNLKIQEAYLALEYQLRKQQEKEEAKEARAQMREAAKLQKEIEEQRRKIEKEQAHYQKALLTVLKQLESAPENEKVDLLAKREELEKELGDIEISLKDIDYREANQRAGYVYVISNIGSFGKDVYKIGMTRRLDPQERVDELGDASVPFNFDVHAMIFSDDAPALETALHHAFEDKKLNMVNHRREFFHVTLDEIKEVIKQNYDKTVEFVDVPDAEQYRISEKMRTCPE
ncbi:DUF4041 domain-containing protein [Acetatifactor aquisgranensis]|uniref:DUF4041 domain-containing protein n=1 Tax=Acetatifactor aquisgranensis TaxID=2941233 RepID=UPI00203D9E31|nr:DUF4041 domain-containing protein [Acetatifactor aquisgranensis]